MAYLQSYTYRDRKIIDISSLLTGFKFIIINLILAIIFLFLSMEEIDWAIYSSRITKNDKVIDKTSWNINNLFLSFIKI